MGKIYRKDKIHSALYVIKCPNCDTYLVSASEHNLLPESASCDCDKKVESEIINVPFSTN